MSPNTERSPSPIKGWDWGDGDDINGAGTTDSDVDGRPATVHAGTGPVPISGQVCQVKLLALRHLEDAMNDATHNELKVTLTKAIDKWSVRACAGGELDFYFTDNLIAQMADAAMLVLKVSADKEQWLKDNGYWTEK